MTVEELAEILDKGNRFYIIECYSKNVIFESMRKDKRLWKEAKNRNVVQVTACTGELMIYVNDEQPVRNENTDRQM